MYIDYVIYIGEYSYYPIKILEQFLILLEGSLRHQDRYLCEKVEIIKTNDGQVMWPMNYQEYMKNAIDKAKKLSGEDGKTLRKRGKSKGPMLKNYYLDLDESKELEDPNTYHHLTGILIWACDFGQIDILTEVSVLCHNLCNPREGHLDAVFHILNYLNVKRECIPGKLVFDDLEHPTYICLIKGVLTE